MWLNKLKPTHTQLSQKLTPSLLGLAIRARRTQSKLRLEDAADLCKVAKQTFQNIEEGLGGNRLETILKICHGLGVQLRMIPWENND